MDTGNSFIKDIMTRFSAQNGPNSTQKKDTGGSGKLSIEPSQALVIAGLLGGALEVISVLVDRDQKIQIILEGSLKQKTQLEKMLDELGNMPFDQVVKAMLNRLE